MLIFKKIYYIIKCLEIKIIRSVYLLFFSYILFKIFLVVLEYERDENIYVVRNWGYNIVNV